MKRLALVIWIVLATIAPALSAPPPVSAALIAPDGKSIQLFSNVGNSGNHANFNNTIFSDSGTTSIESGGPPGCDG